MACGSNDLGHTYQGDHPCYNYYINISVVFYDLIMFMKEQPVGDLQTHRNTKTNVYLEACILTREIRRMFFIILFLLAFRKF